jgi:glycine cleavage system H lipoate-binding protein
MPRARQLADPKGNGWLFKMKLGDRAELAKLLDETAYRALIG